GNPRQRHFSCLAQDGRFAAGALERQIVDVEFVRGHRHSSGRRRPIRGATAARYLQRIFGAGGKSRFQTATGGPRRHLAHPTPRSSGRSRRAPERQDPGSAATARIYCRSPSVHRTGPALRDSITAGGGMVSDRVGKEEPRLEPGSLVGNYVVEEFVGQGTE